MSSIDKIKNDDKKHNNGEGQTLTYLTTMK